MSAFGFALSGDEKPSARRFMEAAIDKIYLSPPHLNGAENKYVQQAFASNWVAPIGENIDMFEQEVKTFVDMPYALAVNSGTAAMHLALMYIGVGPGDIVFCSDVTFAASCNPIKYLQAEPVFIDSDLNSWCMSPTVLQDALELCQRRGKLPKAVIVVDLYGLPADFDAILDICAAFGVPVIEDAAESLGASYKGRMCGSFGDLSILSFNANKMITTSGGGMVLAKEAAAIEKMKYWATQARENTRHYEHKEIGFNYRLSNISAGIGRGQMECIDLYVESRRQLYIRYVEELSHLPVSFYPTLDGAEPNCWLSIMVLEENCGVSVNDIIDALERANIEARPFWKPMHQQPVFASCEFHHQKNQIPVGQQLFANALCLPSGSAMTETAKSKTIETVRRCFKGIALG